MWTTREKQAARIPLPCGGHHVKARVGANTADKMRRTSKAATTTNSRGRVVDPMAVIPNTAPPAARAAAIHLRRGDCEKAFADVLPMPM